MNEILRMIAAVFAANERTRLGLQESNERMQRLNLVAQKVQRQQEELKARIVALFHPILAPPDPESSEVSPSNAPRHDSWDKLPPVAKQLVAIIAGVVLTLLIGYLVTLAWHPIVQVQVFHGAVPGPSPR